MRDVGKHKLETNSLKIKRSCSGGVRFTVKDISDGP